MASMTLDLAQPAYVSQRSTSNAASQALYAYTVVPVATPAPSCEGLLPDLYVESIGLGALNVLASRVPVDIFETGGKNPEWVAARAAAHHAVNVVAAARGPCLPLTFGALFSDIQALRTRMAPSSPALLHALHRIGRKSEWTIRLHEDPAVHAAWLDHHDETLASVRRSLDAAGEGTAFLLQRRLGKAKADARTAHLNTVTARIGALLAQAGLDVIASSRQGLPEWSVLAPSNERVTQAVESAKAELMAGGLGLDVSGPWPAYAFARAALQDTANA